MHIMVDIGMFAMPTRSDPTIADVRSYWQAHPLLSYELDAPGSKSFFDQLDFIKKTDVERFAMAYWEFDRFKGREILDVGCGPGWLTVQYAKGGANVTAVDLTARAVELTRQNLAGQGLKAVVQEANAEALPFDDNAFDLVASSGVLHHTVNPSRAFAECYRVLKPGGVAKITLYRLGILHSPLVFPLTRAAMRLLAMRHPGADMGRDAGGVDDFVRQYDGKDNPIGLAKKDRIWAAELAASGFRLVGQEVHFFPRRFIPLQKLIPTIVHRFLDSSFGTMIYYKLSKP
jgi:SAM-dependent methyltransferase